VKGGLKKATYGEQFQKGGLDCECLAPMPHVKSAAADTTRWAETEDGRVIAPPCCGTKGPNRCDYPKVPTDPLQLPDRLRGGWTEGMKKAAWCNYVSLQSLKTRRRAQLKAAGNVSSVEDVKGL
jgi:hypothetical protein